MSPSRVALNALHIPNVVNARASGDYQPGNDQWKIGISSIFAHAMGIAPFKDNFWTTTNQSGNIYNKSEPYPELQSLVATLSTGPVAPSDKIGYSNKSLIMRSCNSEGLILKPSKPATAVDSQMHEAAYNGFTGEVWSTFSYISGHMFGMIFAADFSPSDTFSITPSQAGFGPNFASSFIASWFSTSSSNQFDDQNPLVLSGCTKKDFCYYVSAPTLNIAGNEVELVGELDKWVPMSPHRVTHIDISSSEVGIHLSGGAEESVVFSTALNGVLQSTTCVLSPAGHARLLVLAQTCHWI